MRVGFDTSSLCVTKSGVGTYVAQLYEALRGNPEVTLFPLAPCCAPITSHRRLRPAHLNKTLWMQFLLPLELGHINVDVCHFTNGVAPAWVPTPSVVTIHDMTLWLYPQYHYFRRLVSMRPFMRLAAWQASAIIAVSETTKRDIERVFKVPSEKITVVYEAASPQFRPISNAAYLSDVRERMSLPPNFILYVGSIEPRKNLVRLIHAVARVRDTARPDIALVIVGSEAWRHKNVLQAIEETNMKGCVYLLGYVPTEILAAIYNLADLFVYPSLYEGFGLPVLEAMACGVPVITSPRGSLQEIAGDAAAFIDPTEVDQIAITLSDVLANNSIRDDLRQRGLRRAQMFSWEAAALRTKEIYCQVLAQ